MKTPASLTLEPNTVKPNGPNNLHAESPDERPGAEKPCAERPDANPKDQLHNGPGNISLPDIVSALSFALDLTEGPLLVTTSIPPPLITQR